MTPPRNSYNPSSTEPFKLSRTALYDFIKCPRCFYTHRSLGVARPAIPGYSLNSAVDELLKKEFDYYRDDDWKDSWKKQLEVYSYIFQQNGYKVYNTAYFVYCNGKKELDNFDGKLDFDVSLVPYKWDASWVEEALVNAKACLDSESLPAYSDNCDYCKYLIKHQEIL